MKKKIFIPVLILLIIIIYFCFIRNTSKNDAIRNINQINDIIKININNIYGTLKTVHTTNMVHAENKEIKKEYDFILENNLDNILIYLENKKVSIKKDNIYELLNVDNINNCNITKNNNKYNIKCDKYEIKIYYSKIFKKYIKSIINYNGFTYTYTKNSLEIKNNNIIYQYSIINDNNYKLVINNNINIYYSNGSYEKYSVSYQDINFNIIRKENGITISMPCEVDKYTNLEINISNNDLEKKESYKEISLQELLEIIMSEEIYSLFN